MFYLKDELTQEKKQNLGVRRLIIFRSTIKFRKTQEIIFSADNILKY